MAFKIYFYDDESSCVGTGCLSSSYLQYKLQEAQGQDIEVHISSMGGSAFDAVAIYDMLKKYTGKVTTIVDSVAASAAATVFMAGSERIISKYGLLMIHQPSGGTVGTSQDMASYIKMLDKVQEIVIAIYSDATGIDIEAATALVQATTWFNADEALAAGFATSIYEYSEDSAAVTNYATLNISSIPAQYQTVINKVLTPQITEMKDEDKALIEKNNGLMTRVMNFFKKSTVETVSNKGKIISMAPLNVGVSVTNEADEDLGDDEYEVDNDGKKTVVSVKGGKVTSMKTDDTDAAEAANLAVLNIAGIQVTNKADASGLAAVVTNYQTQISERNAIIADLNAQLKVSNEAVERDETKIKADIKSKFTPDGSQRSTTGVVNQGNPFALTSDVAKNSVAKVLKTNPDKA